MSDCKVIVLFISETRMQGNCHKVVKPFLTSLTEVHTDLGKLP